MSSAINKGHLFVGFEEIVKLISDAYLGRTVTSFVP